MLAEKTNVRFYCEVLLQMKNGYNLAAVNRMRIIYARFRDYRFTVLLF